MVMIFGTIKKEENGVVEDAKPLGAPYKAKSRDERDKNIDNLMEELQSAKDYSLSMRRAMDPDYYGDWFC